MPVPFAFGAATSAIPLSQLDSNFNTTITLGNTAIQLGNTVTTLNNMTLANVTISSGNVTLTNVIVTTANVTTANITNLISGNVSLTGGAISNTTLGAATASTANVTTLTTSSTVTLNGGTANGVAYLNGSKVLTTGSSLTFDGSVFQAPTLNTTGTANFASNVYLTTNATYYQSRTTGGAYIRMLGLNSGNTAYVGPIDPGPVDMIVNASSSSANIQFYTAGTERMRIESATGGVGAVGIGYTSLTSVGNNGLAVLGNVGIGTSSPAYKLQLNSGSAVDIETGVSNSAGLSRYGTRASGNAFLGAFTAGKSLELWSANSQNATLDSSGNLGLGVTPSVWGLGKAIEVGNVGNSIWGASAGNMLVAANMYYSGGYRYAATGQASQYQQNAGVHSWFNAPSGTTAGDPITFTQAMTLDASGNLVVGGTSAVYTNANRGNISINGTSTAILALSTGGTGRAYLYSDGSRLDLLNTQNDALTFGTNNAERARISSDGTFRVKGAGTAGSTDAFQVAGTAPADAARIDSSGNLLVGTTSGVPDPGIKLSPLGAVDIGNNAQASGWGFVSFNRSGTAIGSITQSGTTAVLYNVTSDQRLKENIQDAAPASALIDSLQVRQYDWKADGNHQRYGFVAQELVTVAPEAVHQPVDPDEMMGVDYSKLVPMLVKEIQSLRQRVAQLEGK